MLSPKVLSLAIHTAGLVVAGIGSGPALRSAIRQIRPKSSGLSQGLHLYQDPDGPASETSMVEFSDRFPRTACAVLTLVGAMVALSRAVLTTDEPGSPILVEQWLQFGTWVILLAQCGALLTEPVCTTRFRLGCYMALGTIVWLVMLCTEFYYVWYELQTWKTAQSILSAVDVVLALLVACSALLLPRRPDVLRNGTIVDRQFTVSALSRLNFSWVESLLSLAALKRDVRVGDLPELDHRTRSETLQTSFAEQQTGDSAFGKSRKLWKVLARCHWSAIVLQFVLAVALSILSFFPQIALLQTLQSLEAPLLDPDQSTRVWLWVVGLGLSMALSSTIDTWLVWISYSGLNIKIVEQLATVIFDKAVRRKDVKEPAQTKTPEGGPSVTKPKKDGNSSTSGKTHQSTINLIAVDTWRIADFASQSYLLFQCPLQLAIACTLLAQLVGWQGLLAGVGVLMVLMPLNGIAAKRYSRSQGRIMRTRDSKVSVILEALQGIRQIKFTALESRWEEKINAFRDSELRSQWTACLWQTALFAMYIVGPVMLSAASLSVYAIINGGLTASVAFTSVSMFGSIEVALTSLPASVAALMNSLISLQRVEEFLNAPESACNSVPADNIAFLNASISWPSHDAAAGIENNGFHLQNLNLDFPKGGLSVISGLTGSGKSLLLASIVGECEVISGTIKAPPRPTFNERINGSQWTIDSAMAYVSQVPWIENASIKDNIIFGLPFDSERYKKTLFACALEPDMASFADGESTEIGARGVNLSGGQKWRITLARALYSRAGILLMDDVFSAVDAHTGRHLFDHALTGELARGRTRVLITHHTALCLSGTDYAIHLDRGSVSYAGPARDAQGEILSIQSPGTELFVDATDTPDNNDAPVKQPSRPQPESNSKPTRKFVKDEGKETGSIKWGVYKGYITHSDSFSLWFLVLSLYLGYSALAMARAWWLNIWSSQDPAPERVMSVMHHAVHQLTVTAQKDYNLSFYITVYVGMSLLACVVGSIRTFFVLAVCLRSSRNLFRHLLRNVFRAPMRWLDTVPLGRVLNRFTSDFNTVDSSMGMVLGNTIFNSIEVVSTVMAGVLVNPVLGLFTTTILLMSLFFARRYLTAAREIKRLESTAKSPIFVQFDSVLNGLDTIRAFGKQTVYIDRMQGIIDGHARAYWHTWLLNRWLAYRMNMMGAIFTTTTALLAIVAKGTTAAAAGFAISFALRYTAIMSRATQIYSTMELSLNSVERIQEYTEVATEEDTGIDPPAAWPTRGCIEVSDLVVGYAPDLPPVLQGLNFQVEENQRIGVVGRTGAGKSSLALTLFRFLDIRQGQIYVDGIDVSKIKLHHLRSRLAIIPQDPVLFSGTVRSNLDPFGEYDDLQLAGALERVHWGGSARTEQTRSLLDIPVSEGGQNLSQGQRQLLCLARAIVSRPKIMILDEATSAVDKHTDELLQQSVRSEFGRHSTLLVIAHRISTIADFDRILVLDAGRAVEFGAPQDLMKIPGGVFRGLVEENGEREELERIIHGN